MLCWDLLLILFLFFVAGFIFFLSSYRENKVITSPLTPLFTKGKRVRIILPTGGSGLNQDAKIYQQNIPNSYIIQVDRNSPDKHPEAEVYADVNLYLESLHGRSFFFPAKERWLMVNQEYLYPENVGYVDVLIAKSRYAEKILRDYVTKMSLQTRVIYLGHTSLLTPLDEDNYQGKDWHLLVHLAGKSRQKGTRQLIQLWQKNGGFRHLDPQSRLIITCRDMCFVKVVEELQYIPRQEKGWVDEKTGLVVYLMLDEKELDELKRQAGLFICPSLVEGYGHYINEGTANRALVMTTDFPPMNELVPKDNPFMIKPEIVVDSWEIMEPFGVLEPLLTGKYLPQSQACYPDLKHTEELLCSYFTMPESEKERLAQLNYEFYLERQKEFKDLLTKFVRSN